MSYKTKRPKSDKLGRAHDLPNLHKEYNNISKFRPIVGTIGTPHFSVWKILEDWKIHLMQLIKIKIYYVHLIGLMMDKTMYLLMWNLYSKMLPSKKL